MKNTTLSHLSNDALIAEVARLARAEHDATVALITHLAELAARRLFLGAGFSSLFGYCREVLGLSEGEAYNRVVAARAVRKFPAILDRLAEGSINLTTIRLLFKHLTPENHRELVDASRGKSKRDVEKIIATHFPQPVVPFSVRKLPALPPPVVAPPAPLALSVEPDRPAPAPFTVATSIPIRPAALKPIAEDLYSVRFTATAATWEKLQAAQELLRHSLRDGDVAQIFDRALTLLLADVARKKFAATNRPRSSKRTKRDSRDLPNALMRAVWVRDCARCRYVSASGRRCSERGRLEFHHRHRYTDGGKATLENIQLRCRAHNVYEEFLHYAPLRELADTVRETIPGWDVSPRLSRDMAPGE
jgi:hypothetical protein